MTLRPLRVPSMGASQSPSLAQHRRLEAERHALSQQRSSLLGLEQRLQGITDEPRWNVNVPIGPLAWMPGQLVNTNTVKVRLSEDYIVEYSAKQAVEVAKRRRTDLDKRIAQVERQLSQVDQGMRKDLDLPDGWSINGSNEVVNESGLPCYEIREELSNDEEDEDWEVKRRHTAEAERQVEREEAVARALRPQLDLEKLFTQAEEDEAKELAATNESEEEQEPSQPPTRPEPAHIMELDEEPGSKAQPPPEPQEEEAPASHKPALKSILSSPKLDIPVSNGADSPAASVPGSPRTGPKKSVKWNVSGPQPEAEADKKRKVAIPLPPPDGSTTQSSSAPMKSSVVERPFNQSVKPAVVEKPTANNPKVPTGPKVHHFDEIGSDSDEDEELDGDYDEWNSEDEADDFDALMLQRELAMQYHAKRFELGAGSNSGALGGANNPNAWDLEHQDYVPEDTSLATGQHTATQASRFAGGRMQNSRLVIPSLLQQAGLQPGDVLDNAPWSALHGRSYTREEEAKIQERIEQLGRGDEDEPPTPAAAQSAQQKPEVISLEDALAEATGTPQQPLGQDVVDKPMVTSNGLAAASPADPPANKPKRVSRFKAARLAES